jgi:predicted nucleotidyltransferase
MTPAERKALDDYVAAVREYYGTRLVDVLVFGSRARSDHRPDSDVDPVILLEDGERRFWEERWYLSDLANDAMVQPGLWMPSLSRKPHDRPPGQGAHIG